MDISRLNYLWLDSPFFDDILKELNLTEAERMKVMTFKEDGYLIIETGIDEAKMDRIIHNTKVRYAGAEHETKRALDAWKSNADIQSIASLPLVYDVLRLLYQREPIPFQSINFNIGSEKMAHSDAIHFHSVPEGFMCGVWIALEDIHARNGPIELYPGSHKLPYVTMSDVGKLAKNATTTYEFYADYEKYVENLVAKLGLKSKQIHLKKGQAIIWASNMLHSGSAILDRSLTRYSQVTHYYFENCMYYGPLFSDVPLGKLYYWKVVDIKTGKQVAHNYLGETIETHPGKLQKIYNIITEKTRSEFLY
jgi:hypothetical protein